MPRVQEEIVLGEKAGEEEPVPLLVGALGDEQVGVAAELALLCAQAIAQGTTLVGEMLGPAIGEYREAVERGARGALGSPASGENR